MIGTEDEQIDRYITGQIGKRGITLYDIIGGKYIDPTPQKKGQNQRARWNRFSSFCRDLRLSELLTEGEFDPDLPYNNLSIPLKDLVRYWWNNCADQKAMLGDILEDIPTLCNDRMLPKKEEPVDVWDVFDGLLEVV